MTKPHYCFIPDDNQEAAKAATHETIRALGCQADATWDLSYGPSPDDNTQSCNEHVAALLGDEPLLNIIALP